MISMDEGKGDTTSTSASRASIWLIRIRRPRMASWSVGSKDETPSDHKSEPRSSGTIYEATNSEPRSCICVSRAIPTDKIPKIATLAPTLKAHTRVVTGRRIQGNTKRRLRFGKRAPHPSQKGKEGKDSRLTKPQLAHTDFRTFRLPLKKRPQWPRGALQQFRTTVWAAKTQPIPPPKYQRPRAPNPQRFRERRRRPLEF